MSEITDRALFQLIAGFRYNARTQAVLHADDPEEAEARAWVFRYCASVLEQAAGFCGVCDGRGVEFSEAFEDEPAEWFECSMCSGSGRSRWALSCGKCGKLDDPDMLESLREPGVQLCMLCAGMERTEARTGVPPFEIRRDIPLGPNV